MRYICNACEGYAFEIKTKNEEALAGFSFIRSDLNGNFQIRHISAYDFTILVELYKKKMHIKDYEYRTVMQNDDFYIALMSPDFRRLIMLAQGKYMDTNIASMNLDEDILKFMNFYFDSGKSDVIEVYKEYNSFLNRRNK